MKFKDINQGRCVICGYNRDEHSNNYGLGYCPEYDTLTGGRWAKTRFTTCPISQIRF